MASTRTAEKSPSAFRTISEVADDLQVPQHVLRFWETKFSQVRPLKRGGNRRYYRPEDIELLRKIRDLLYSDGYTIKGVQKLLREGQVKNGKGPGAPAPARESHAAPEASSAPESDVTPEPPAQGAEPASTPTADETQAEPVSARGEGGAQVRPEEPRLSEAKRAQLQEVLDILLELRKQLDAGG